jgi:hypothetical protein
MGNSMNSAVPAPALQLPTIKLGGHDVTRLILGSNPFNGYGHFNNILAQHMLEWFTPENCNKTLRLAENNGINTWQFSATKRGLPDFDRYLDAGGKLQHLILASRAEITEPAKLANLARRKPIGILHHGSVTDDRWRRGEREQIRDFVKQVHDLGLPAGISTHNPEVIDFAEEHGWGVDFYMACVYHVSRTAEEVEKLLGRKPPVLATEVYFPDDPPRMFKTIRQTSKPCLAFKILAAGRVTDAPDQIETAFRTAFANIKPIDAVIVGMYPRFSNQVQENAERVRRILGSRS